MKNVFFCDIKTADFSEKPAASTMRVDDWHTQKAMEVQEEGGIGQISGRATDRWDKSKSLNRQNGWVFEPNLPCSEYDPVEGFCEHDIDYRFQ